MSGRLTTGAFALLILGALSTGCGGGSGEGPIGAGDLHYGQALDVGQDMSFGTVTLFVDEGDKPATIEEVKVVGASDGLQLLGVRTRPIPSPSGNFLADYGFPPKDFSDSKPLKEANVVPATDRRTEDGSPLDGLMLVIGLRTTQPGITAAKGVEVQYKIGNRRYTETFDQHVFLCAPVADYEGGEGCPPEDAKDNFGEGVLG